jgi:hypothetical protein
MADRPIRQFGKRGPVAVEPAPPVKRSGHVALLLMGTMAIGGGGYALMPNENCGPNGPGMASDPQAGAACASRHSWSGYGHGSWSPRSSFFGGDSSPGGPASAASTDARSGTVTRGGFGSFARAFTATFSGGG